MEITILSSCLIKTVVIQHMPRTLLNVNRMNVNPDRCQARMGNTIWNGQVQTMVLQDETPKGMRMVLQKPGVDVNGMKGDDMRKNLKEMHDFKYEKTKIETLVATRGHQSLHFYSKTPL